MNESKKISTTDLYSVVAKRPRYELTIQYKLSAGGGGSALVLLRTHGLEHAETAFDLFKRAEKSVLSEYVFGEDNKTHFDTSFSDVQLNVLDHVTDKTILHHKFGD